MYICGRASSCERLLKGGRPGFGRAQGRCLLAPCDQTPCGARCCCWQLASSRASPAPLLPSSPDAAVHRSLSTTHFVALPLARLARCRLPWDFRRGTGQPVTADSFPAAGPTVSGAAPAPGLAAEEAAAAAAGPPAPSDALTDTETADGPCLIKGNISRAGAKIFTVPGSPSYDQTQIDESRGERWFCSEEEAVAAGWRPPG